MINTIFFDFDGVIVESVDIKTKAFVRLFERESEDVVKKVVEYHLNNTGVSRYEKFKYIYKEILNHALCDAEFQMLCDKFASLVLDAVVLAPYVKGAKEFLENFVSKYRFFVVTATPQEEIDVIIQRRVLSASSEQYMALQRRNQMRLETFSKRINPCDTIYIGDAMIDFNAAKDNFVRFIE